MSAYVTLRDLLGLGASPAPLRDSALIMIDCQNTYRQGVMRLEGAEEAFAEAARLLTGQPTASIQDGLAWIRQTLTLLAVPGLATFGIRPQHADEIAAKALTSSSMQGNPVALSHGDLKAILERAL